MAFKTQRTHTQAPAPRATLEDLYLTLDARKRPEDVAHMIAEVLGSDLTRREQRILDAAARGSLKHTLHGYTSMLEDFFRPVGLGTQIATAQALFSSAYRMSVAECADPIAVEAFLRHVGLEIGKTFGASDYMHDRKNRAARKASGMDISRRRYNKLFRHVARMERKLASLVRELKKLQFTKIGKSSLACRIAREDFFADTNTACFIAYYTARCNLRSEFTIAGQKKAYDTIAAMLYARCDAAHASWWAMAHVYPTRAVLAKLTESQKGELLGVWHETLRDIAQLLQETWEVSNINRKTMIVRRGNDSTTWNNTANAWNRARTAWVALLYEMGYASVLDDLCPGKVLRLMAADVAYWHASAGGGLDPDTMVWSELPLPWQVLSGDVACGRGLVQATCDKYGVDARGRGWIAPPPTRKAVRFTPTPELVHGVSVSSPTLATALRKAGWFSGKKVRKVTVPVLVRANSHGFVTGAYDTDPGGTPWNNN